MVIVGAGPAGVSAALWARAHDLEPLVLEATPGPGGQLLNVHFEPHDLAGGWPGEGPAIAGHYHDQLAAASIDVRYGASVEALALGPEPQLTLVGGERLTARALLVATGARRRRLDVPGERELEDKGLSYSARRGLGQLKGRMVAVVGGGDAACENGLILAAAGCEVTIVARAGLRARPEFRERVAAERRIRVLEGARVLEVLGRGRVEGLRLGQASGETRLACEAVVIKVGVVPATEWCRGVLAHDEAGYLRVDGSFATPAAGVWAAGDVVRPAVLSVAVAIGQGALAAASIRNAIRG